MKNPWIILAAVLGAALPTGAALAQTYQEPPFSAPYEGNANGGYHLNRYGYGRYVGGPAGGFGGYPAGSGGAQILKQTQEWKCRDVPERC